MNEIRKGCLVKHKITDAIGLVLSEHEVTCKVRWQGVLCDDGRLVSEAPQYYSYAYQWDLEHYYDYEV